MLDVDDDEDYSLSARLKLQLFKFVTDLRLPQGGAGLGARI